MRTNGTTKKALVVVAAAVAIAGFAYAVYLRNALSLSSQCVDEMKKEASSPDGEYTASFIERNCGATTDYSSIVSLRQRGDRFDADKNENILVIDGQCGISLLWSGRTLVASYPKSCRLFRRSETWRDVRISFREL